MLERKSITAIDVAKIFEQFLAIFVQVKGNPKQLMSNYTAINVWRKSITAIDVAIMFEQFLDIFVQEKKLSRAINVQLHDN